MTGAWVLGPMSEEEAKRKMLRNPSFEDVRFNKVEERVFEVLKNSAVTGHLYQEGGQWIYSPIEALPGPSSPSKWKKALKVGGLFALLGGTSYAWWKISSAIKDEIEGE